MSGLDSKHFYGWRIAFLGFALMAVAFTIALNCASLFVKPIIETFGLSRSEVALISTIMTLTFGFSAPYVGKIIDNLGIKITMSIGSIFVSAGLIGYSISTGIGVMYAFSVVIGIGLSLCTLIPINLLINNWFIDKKGLVTGIVFSGSGLGGFFLSQATARLLEHLTWSKTYLILGVFSLVITLPLILIIVKTSPREIGQAAYRSSANKSKPITDYEVKGYTLNEIRWTPVFILVSITCFLINIVGMGMVSHLPAHLTDLGYSASFAANVTSFYLLGMVFGKISLGFILDKFGGKKGFLIGTLSIILGLVAMLFSSNKFVAMTFPVVFFIGGAMPTVSIAFLTSDIFGNKDFASIYGVINLIGLIGTALGAPLSGIVFDNFESYNIAWIGYIILSVIMYKLTCSSYKSILNMRNKLIVEAKATK